MWVSRCREYWQQLQQLSSNMYNSSDISSLYYVCQATNHQSKKEPCGVTVIQSKQATITGFTLCLLITVCERALDCAQEYQFYIIQTTAVAYYAIPPRRAQHQIRCRYCSVAIACITHTPDTMHKHRIRSTRDHRDVLQDIAHRSWSTCPSTTWSSS